MRVKGQLALSKTFHDRSQARAWAAEVGDLVRRGRYDFGKEVDIPKLGEALDLYARKVTVKKRSAAKEAYVINVCRRSGLTALPLDKITPRALTALRDKWLNLLHFLTRLSTKVKSALYSDGGVPRPARQWGTAAPHTLAQRGRKGLYLIRG